MIKNMDLVYFNSKMVDSIKDNGKKVNSMGEENSEKKI